jgi:hypothetical protein
LSATATAAGRSTPAPALWRWRSPSCARYRLGVSTRRMEELVESLGITRLSKSQVSEMAKDLDAQVADFVAVDVPRPEIL